MKILYPLEVFYPSQAGGTANTVYWIVKNLTPFGIEPVIIATDKGLPPDVPLNKWTESDCGKVVYVRTRFMRLPLFQIYLSLQNILRADIVHVSSVFFPTSIASAFFAYLLRKKLIWSVHGELDSYALTFSKNRKRLVLWLVKKIMRKYPFFHSTCDEETGYIKNVFGDDVRIEQITNYFEAEDKYPRRGSRSLLFIGRLNHKKGIDNLIRALALSKTFRSSAFVLKIAGDGNDDYKKDLIGLIKQLDLTDKVEFVGQVEGDTKHQLLADAYFMIMPSHTENFGLVVIESLAQNTPVIASIHTPWKSLEKEDIGFWVENSPEELAKTIDKVLMMSDTEYEKCRQRGREFVLREFDIRKNIGKWVEVYNSLD